MRLKIIRYSALDTSRHESINYELNPESLPANDFETLRQLIGRTGLLSYQSQHRGPAQGEHEFAITLEALDGTHQSISCEVAPSADQQDLADFIKEHGYRVIEKRGIAKKIIPMPTG